MGVQSVLPSQPPCAMQTDWACWCFGVRTPTKCDDKFVKRVSDFSAVWGRSISIFLRKSASRFASKSAFRSSPSSGKTPFAWYRAKEGGAIVMHTVGSAGDLKRAIYAMFILRR